MVWPRSRGALVNTTSVTSWRKVSRELAGQRSNKEWRILVRWRWSWGLSITTESRPSTKSIDIREDEVRCSPLLSGRVSRVATSFKVFPRIVRKFSVLTWNKN